MKNNGIPSLEILITRTESKYIDLLKSGRWNATPKDEIILALRAKTEELEKRNKKRKKEKKKSKKSKRKTNKKRKSSNYEEKDETWMFEKPKSGSDLSKVVIRDGKKWNWCTFHKKWVLLHGRFGKHTSDTCSKNPKNQVKKEGESKKKKEVKIDVNLAEDTSDEESSKKSTSNESSESDDDGSTKSDE